MKFNEVYEYFGTHMRIANALGISTQAISVWAKNDIVPIKQQLLLEKITSGKLKADIDKIKD